MLGVALDMVRLYNANERLSASRSRAWPVALTDAEAASCLRRGSGG